ncbi:unnamed protein product [Zymoseptoria tritici ST99CH_3D1]|nr:unnamed protein product [Zymoseptoria tritici ST99CH_3D1]
MGPEQPLPYLEYFTSPGEYVNSLLEFVGTHDLLRTLCGGVHILDFFTSTPRLYPRILPQEWRDFFDQHDVMDILDLLMRVDLSQFETEGGQSTTWRSGPLPPDSLLDYIRVVRKHLLNRQPGGTQCSRNRTIKHSPAQKLSRNVAVGMNVKKVHEVGLFASYLDTLSSTYTETKGEELSHLVDFGSGQNYLGRALASEPYNKKIVAIESRQANADRAREFDVFAKLAKKKMIMRNKKAFRETGIVVEGKPVEEVALPTSPLETELDGDEIKAPAVELPRAGSGKITYVDHRIQDGNLSEVIAQIPESDEEQNLMVMSLHSCGNLVHHGLRSLLLNPSVKCVAMVGCCYNLVTERLGPATYKLPELRPQANPRVSTLAEAQDPNGFPMSQRFCDYYREGKDDTANKGVRLNITSRMMAVQAPGNWGPADSESFFTRHFYRALLQRIFLDRGIVGPPAAECVGGASPAGHSSGGTPIVIGSLRKMCYSSFASYVRGALEKLVDDPTRGELFTKMKHEVTEDEIEKYEVAYASGKKDLSVIWSLMAFSAGVVEAAIVVDRWLWLKEQDEVEEAWVDAVFDYAMSPRNLVIVGIKK